MKIFSNTYNKIVSILFKDFDSYKLNDVKNSNLERLRKENVKIQTKEEFSIELLKVLDLLETYEIESVQLFGVDNFDVVGYYVANKAIFEDMLYVVQPQPGNSLIVTAKYIGLERG